jgi:hypothetical protein
MTIKNTGDLLSTISSELADNNAGLISAQDVRHNLEDIVESINLIVSSGDFDTSWAFVNDVRADRNATTNTGGMFIPESGINFVNGGGIQYVPYPGPQGINHNDLAGRNSSNIAHTQYLAIDGSREMAGNLRMADNFIGASGDTGRGVKFLYINDNREDLHILGLGQMVFESDSSVIRSAKSVAKAWINFNSSGNVISGTEWTPTVNESFNISKLERESIGKFKVTFASGIFDNNSYVALGHAMGRHTGGSITAGSDFSQVYVGLVHRTGDESSASSPRTCTFYIKADDGEYVESEICDLVVYGRASGVVPESDPETPAPAYG